MRPVTPRPRALFLLACVPLLIAAAHPATTATPADDDARTAAEAWLALMDADEYEQAWNEAGHAFQSAITAEAWTQQATAVRQQIGDVVSRERAADSQLTDPPGAPPGEYFQIQYQSEFGGVGAASEMLILINEAERGWRVVGYFVQPPAH
jgi:hypothetical protein